MWGSLPAPPQSQRLQYGHLACWAGPRVLQWVLRQLLWFRVRPFVNQGPLHLFFTLLLATSLRSAFRPIVPLRALSALWRWMSSFPIELGSTPAPQSRAAPAVDLRFGHTAVCEDARALVSSAQNHHDFPMCLLVE